ncbi:PIN domain-containing protein [Priestia megaterium]
MHQYEYGLILDTNVFIHLSQNNYYPNYVQKTFLFEVLHNQDIKFIIPKQVQIEWERVIKEKEAILIEAEKRQLSDALKVAKYIDDKEQANTYKEALTKALKLKDRYHRYTFRQRVNVFNDFIFDEGWGLKVDRTREIDSLLVDLSLNHTAPFFGTDKGKGKINEMADALIFFTAYDFAKNNPQLCKNYFFITDETNFSKGPNLHNNIKGYAEEAGLQFYCSFKTFIDEKSDELSQMIDEQGIRMGPKTIVLDDKYFIPCKRCNEEVHTEVDSFNNKTRPTLRCRNCGYEWPKFIKFL